MFELLAAGALSAVLVPTFVTLIDAGNDDEADRLANGLLGYALVVMGVIAVLGVVGAAARALVVEQRAERARGRRAAPSRRRSCSGSSFPRSCSTRSGGIATALLYAKRQFSITAAAPIGSSVVMIVCFVAFRDGRRDAGLRHDVRGEDVAGGRRNRRRRRVRRDPRGGRAPGRLLAAAALGPRRSRALAFLAPRGVGCAVALGRGDVARRRDRGRQRRGRRRRRVPGCVHVLPRAVRGARAAAPHRDPPGDVARRRGRRSRRVRAIDPVGARSHGLARDPGVGRTRRASRCR